MISSKCILLLTFYTQSWVIQSPVALSTGRNAPKTQWRHICDRITKITFKRCPSHIRPHSFSSLNRNPSWATLKDCLLNQRLLCKQLYSLIHTKLCHIKSKTTGHPWFYFDYCMLLVCALQFLNKQSLKGFCLNKTDYTQTPQEDGICGCYYHANR